MLRQEGEEAEEGREENSSTQAEKWHHKPLDGDQASSKAIELTGVALPALFTQYFCSGHFKAEVSHKKNDARTPACKKGERERLQSEHFPECGWARFWRPIVMAGL